MERTQLRTWLADPARIGQLWFGKPCVVVAWIGLALALVSPPHGSGINVCWWYAATGVPCFGCGVTRSLSCGLRGMFLESWHYHPLGLLILALFVFTAAQSLVAPAWRLRLRASFARRAVFWNGTYLIFVSAFICFGALRALYHGGLICFRAIH